jgi:AcrR family transcriptional regulator
MTAVEDRPLRSDAARNVERILRAAREVYSELGPEAPVETVARHAGVGERTLYRRFPNKADLVRAALDQSIAEDLATGNRRAPCETRCAAGPVDRAAISLSPAAPPLNAAHGPDHDPISTSLDEALLMFAHPPGRPRPRWSPMTYAPDRVLYNAVDHGFNERWLATLRRPLLVQSQPANASRCQPLLFAMPFSRIAGPCADLQISGWLGSHS